MAKPVALYVRIIVQRASGPEVSRQRLFEEVKYAVSDWLLPDDSEYVVSECNLWDAPSEIAAAGQARKFLDVLALDKRRNRNG